MNLNEALEMAVRTDPGLVRPHNEDAVFGDAALGLAILADGMGGYNAGEVASGMATALLAGSLIGTLDDREPQQVDAAGVRAITTSPEVSRSMRLTKMGSSTPASVIHCSALAALSMVSVVVKVFEAITNRVVAGSNRLNASSIATPSTLETIGTSVSRGRAAAIAARRRSRAGVMNGV